MPALNVMTTARSIVGAFVSQPVRSIREFAESEIVIPDGPYEGRKFRCDRQPYTREPETDPMTKAELCWHFGFSRNRFAELRFLVPSIRPFGTRFRVRLWDMPAKYLLKVGVIKPVSLPAARTNLHDPARQDGRHLAPPPNRETMGRRNQF